MAGKRWTNAEIAYLKAHRQNDTIAQIARHLGRSCDAAQNKSARLGLQYMSRQAYPRREVNDRFFQDWTAQMAYVFGYWLADGNMALERYNYSITFVSKDEDHLHKIRKALNSTHRVSDNYDGTHRLCITCKQLWTNLYALGGRPAKSLTIEWPNNIPIRAVRDFIRGYVDGDGCLTIRHVRKTGQLTPVITIAGTKQFLQSLSDTIFDLTGIQSQRVRRLSGCRISEVRYAGIKAQCLAHWLYSSAGLYLDRKRAIYYEFMKWQPKQIKRSFLTGKMIAMFPFCIGA
jgi:hypothetical protein